MEVEKELTEIEKAEQLIATAKQQREEAFKAELQLLCEKYEVALFVSQPQLIIQAK